jgi:serine/threonine protein kinase, bacterial
MEGTLFGRYRLVELLAERERGVRRWQVWRACATDHNDMALALKLLPPHLARDGAFREDFRREIAAAAKLSPANSHVLEIYDFGEIDEWLFVAMRLVQGRDLQAVLAEGPLDPERAVGIVEQVAEALDTAHRAGSLHGGLKPSDILIDDRDHIYLMDYGIAYSRRKAMRRQKRQQTDLRDYLYIAPERLVGVTPDSRSDIYSLACVLYECVTGAPPYPADTMQDLRHGHLELRPPKPSDAQPGVTEGFDVVTARGMAKGPFDRYSSAPDFAKAARASLGRPTPPRPPRRAADPPGPSRQSPDDRAPRATMPVALAIPIAIGIALLLITVFLLVAGPLTRIL